MLSDELPQIIRNWHKPSRPHTSGVRTKAASDALTEWALETVSNMIDLEMKNLKHVLKSSPSDLTEENLLQVRLNN
jgi:hypothetical protein